MVVERDPSHFRLLAIGLILNTVGIGFICWLILSSRYTPFYSLSDLALAWSSAPAGVLGTLLAGFAAASLDFHGTGLH